MRLTSFTDYGLRMLMRMASAPDRAFSTADLADEFGLSRNHLAKIMQRLARAGLIETRGGAALARLASDIRLGAVVRLLEEGQPLFECLSATGGGCTLDGRCQLKARMRSAEAAFLTISTAPRSPISPSSRSRRADGPRVRQSPSAGIRNKQPKHGRNAR